MKKIKRILTTSLVAGLLLTSNAFAFKAAYCDKARQHSFGCCWSTQWHNLWVAGGQNACASVGAMPASYCFISTKTYGADVRLDDRCKALSGSPDVQFTG